MAKKADLLKEAKKLKLKVTEKNTIAEIEAAIKGVETTSKNTGIAPEEVVETVTQDAKEDKPAAKAGKRSDKAQKQTEEKIEKEARKEAGDTTPQSEESESNTKRGPKPVTRSLIERRGKSFRSKAEKVEVGKSYSLAEALALAVETNPAKFDASVEVHVRLGVDPRQADQNIRATVSLPHGTGKKIRVAVFAPESEHAAAKKAGADIVGDEEFLKQLDTAKLDFDTLITSPQYMPRLGKYARLLGPKGLMPNPKAGTVTTNVTKAVTEAKAGRVEYRVDKQAIIHLSIGKVSFGADKLVDNAKVFFDSLNAHRPASLKGSYVRTTNISTTMGPGIKVENVVN